MTSPMTSPKRSVSTLAAPLLMVAVHGMVWAGILFYLCSIAPAYKLIFTEFEMKLPHSTQMVIDLSNLLLDYPPLGAAIFIAALVGDGFVLMFLHRQVQRPWPRWTWFVFVLFVSCAVFALTDLAVMLPLMTLLDS